MRTALLLLVALVLAQPATSSRAADPADSPFTTPGWSVHVYLSDSFGDVAGEIAQVRGGGERVWRNGLALELSGSLGWFDADPIRTEEAGSGVVGGFDVLLRWYYHRKDAWAAFCDIGAGPMWFEEEFPSYNGTSFNFEPQAGFGFASRVGQRHWLIYGARWHHVSNADLYGKEDNRGYDAVMPYIGVRWRP